jgi:pyruvate formate lyase activating enzyme
MGTFESIYPTEYWQPLSDGRIRCTLCPRYCSLREGKRGACFVRQAHQGEVVLTTYGRSSGFCIDPIEKKPLNHFYPGSSVLSFGTAGCNLGCKFCQNWNISKSRQMESLSRQATPQQIANTANVHHCDSIAFTYNDPVIFFEYAVDTAMACREANIHTVAVSAGYINEKPREQFFSVIDAANIDLKAFSERFYKKICGGALAPVLDTLKYLHQETSVWFELTTLLIPGENDSEREIDQMTQWVVEHLGCDVPLHFSAFHPDFKMVETPRTPSNTLVMARHIALRNGLNYVYVGNVHNEQCSSTYCPKCGHKVLSRNWFELGTWALTDTGRCSHCNTPIAGRFAANSKPFGRRRIPVDIIK